MLMLDDEGADRMKVASDLALVADRKRLIRHGTLDLRVALRIVKLHWVPILVATTVTVIAAVFYLHVAPRKYAVQLYITSTSPTSQTPKGLEALSSLAGLSLGSTDNPKFKEFLAAIRSPIAAEAIIGNQSMVRMIFPQEWSVREGRWRAPRSYLRAPATLLKRILGIPVTPWAPPDAAQVYEYLKKNLKVIPDAKSGIVTLELDSARPTQAEALLITLNQVIDDWMRDHDLRHANDDIDYLSREMSKATVEELRVALAANLAEQEKARMLASAPLPYISDTLGTPTASTRPAYPKAVPVLIAAMVVGFLIGFAIALRKYGRG
jgi:uncharacterized protein involved in exopolysaccharide biosynthesis